jgi:hypothetical protein
MIDVDFFNSICRERSSRGAGLGHDEVCGVWRGDVFCAPVTEAHEIKSGKKILAGTNDRRCDRDVHFTDEPRLEILPYRCDTATQSDVLTVRRIPSMSALPPIADVGRCIQVSIWLSVYEYTP